MGHLSTTHTAAACRTGTPGHLDPAPRVHADLLADATAWIPVTVFLDAPAQALVMACPSGARWRGHHHGVGGLAATLRCPLPAPGHDDAKALQLVGAATCHWHPAARVLGVPADPRISAGRAYLELAAGPLEPCRLEHDPALAAVFSAVTGTPVPR